MLLSLRPGSRHCFVIVALGGALILFGQSLFGHDALAEQIARVTFEIARDPANPELFVRRGELYRARRQWKEALADLDHALKLNPALVSADLVRARVLLETGRAQEAIESASRFLVRHPRHVDALVVRARAHVRVGLSREAAADYTRALDERPVPDLYIERAHTMMRSGHAGMEDALRSLDAGIGRLGAIVTLELEAIELELRLKRYDSALTRLDRVSARAVRKETWLARRGAILEQGGRLDEARGAYRAALVAATGLPPSIRQTRASSALIDRLHADLERLGSSDTARPPRTRDNK